MSDTALSARLPHASRVAPILLLFIVVVLVSVAVALALPAFDTWPAEWIVPVRQWVTAFFAWFSAVAKPVTRAIAWVLLQPLALVEALLFRGVPAWKQPPLPWVLIVAGAAILGHWPGSAASAPSTSPSSGCGRTRCRRWPLFW